MLRARYRIEVFHRAGDPRCEVMRKKLAGLGFPVRTVHISDNYLINADIDESRARAVARTPGAAGDPGLPDKPALSPR